jgi:prolyl 4-hydroxylase|tara:strand:- start:961 stop:1485 length:525 start_codon:yes stop_codon:yes gene_type:complete
MNTFDFIEKYKVNKKICDDLLKYYKSNKEYKLPKPHIDNTTEAYFFNPSRDKRIINFFKTLSKHVNEYVLKYDMQNKVKTTMSNHIQHYSANTAYFNLHYERSFHYRSRQLVYMLYLNTVKDKGGTEFPYQQKTFSAIKGDLLIWPAEFTHPHRGIVSPTEEKYIATGWFEIVL